MIKNLFKVQAIILAVMFVISSCEPVEDPTPTNELMEGVWKITKIVDENNEDITQTVTNWFPTFIHLDGQNSVNSTAGPLFMYIVYGKSRFINVASKVDDVFKYANIQLTEGEWFIDKNKVVDNFTVEIKMRFPTAQTLNDVFTIFNVPAPEFVQDALDLIVYHRFKYVTVEVNEVTPNEMIWEFNSKVAADYNTKDQYGDKIAYTGIPVSSFSKCRITFAKQVKGINQLTQDAVNEGYGQAVN